MTEPTAIPVNLYANERELMVVAPMPGVAAEDISVDVTDDGRLTLRARMHGEGRERIDYILREWSYGPYERTVDVPFAVDASRANLSFGNGVLSIALPRAAGTATGAMLAVAPSGHARGMTAGHAGGRGGAQAD
jgi:HSP20 family protein